MKEILLLKLQSFGVRKMVGVADAVMRTDEDKMIWIIQKCANRRNFRAARLLAGSKRIKADHDKCVDRVQNAAIERSRRALGPNTFDLNNRAARLSRGLRDELSKIRLHDMIEKSRNALIETRRIREFLKLR